MSFVAGLSGTVDFEDEQKGKSTTGGGSCSMANRKEPNFSIDPAESWILEEGREGTKAPTLYSSTQSVELSRLINIF